MKTTILTDNKEKIIKGLNTAANIVKTTMGGQGKTVIIASNDEKEGLRFTKDGVSVAESIKLQDELENIGAQILISAAKKTVSMCGDGTTLTSVLLQSMINDATKYLSKTKDVNKLLNTIEDSVYKVKAELQKETNKVEDLFHIKSIASVSANSKRVGQLFHDIYSETGFDTFVTLEKSSYADTSYFEVVKGLEFTNGFVHPAFMTDKDTEQCIYENAYVHLDTTTVSRVTEEYQKLLSASSNENIPLVIIAPAFSDNIIRMCTMNKVNKGVPIVLIKTPGFGKGQLKNIEDIKSFLDRDGYVEKILVDEQRFVLFNSDTPFLEARLEQLKTLTENAIEAYDEIDYQHRIYKLKGSSAILYAGGKTPEALNEEFDRLEDAIGSVRAAVVGGFVEGGGLAMTKIALTTKLHPVVKKAIMCPMTQILKNANVKEVNIDLENIKGYNVKTHQYENFLESGIIDPTNVLLYSLDNALANTKLLVNNSYTLFNEFKQNAF